MKRELYLDTVGGFLLIYMICVHCAQWAGIWLQFDRYTYWLGFFMPWFFFKGGMFYRQKSTMEVARAGYRRLLVPFMWFSAIGCVILWGKLAIEGDLSIGSIAKSFGIFLLNGSFNGNFPLWFLTSLFCVRIIFNYFYQRIDTAKSNNNKTQYVLFRGIMAILCLIFIPYHYLVDYLNLKYFPAYISNISSGLAFYSLGYLLRNYKPGMRLSLLLFAIYIGVAYLSPVHVDMRSGQSESSLYLLWIPYCLLCIVSFNSMAYHFINGNNILSKIGLETMPYYCMHWCVIELTSVFFLYYTVSDVFYFIALVGANIVLLPIMTSLIQKSRLKFILG